MQLSETHIVEKLEKPIRFQEYGVGIFKSIPTKSGIKKAIKKELVFIDGSLATTSKYISGGEKIELFESKNSSTFERLELDIEVLFEDDHLAIIYKPAGILVSGNKFVTIANGLTQNLKKSTLADAVKPQPIHRLDYPTSGLLLIGKTSTAITVLGKLFKDKEIQKTYFAITIGKMNASGIIDLSIDEKKSQTEYEVLESVLSERFGFLNLVKLQPKTGRKHQLRKHLLAIENPILGDKEYFIENKILNGKGLYLHAANLEFIHPFTKESILITKELPKKFIKIFSDF
ncbi:RluA family pseudouridine synthase [Polaribacter sp. Z014]|uniref:RluA family pseudouridine synthase n=1 Tax=unclassified Polaribacter TaxID=196858 RepID=UPI00193B0606|nr:MULTISPECIES: RluA family pseudouridine synthase [unclassified Polaribacter]MCL7763139.1 RluA family pseudouridine synthase [Polaribacter sp. Z014]QVY65440.1 RluA family pseudouridine synthase [Polaribacter sp. Q13]